MDKKFDLSGKLDFSKADLTAPNKVVEDILSQLPEETDGIILGKIEPYTGYVESYTKQSISSMAIALGTRNEEVDIQDSLGARGEENNKYECYIYTPVYDHYKYRLFFMQYGIAHYPVRLTIEDSVARSVLGRNISYIQNCKTREELESLLISILTCKRVLSVMQEIIKIHQAKKDEHQDETVEEETEE